MRRRTTSRLKKYHQPHIHALRARVSSPRIRLYKALRVLRILSLLCLIGAGLYFSGEAAGKLWRRLFHENPEYTLREITVRSNGHLDRDWFLEVSQLDPKSTVFSVDITELKRRLESQAEIISADLVKRLPGTLEVDLVERIPVAWIACPDLSLIERDTESGLLADGEGNLFRCEGRIWDVAKDLPIVRIKAPDPGSNERLQAGGRLEKQLSLSALQLAILATEARHELDPKLVCISQRNDFSLIAEFDDESAAIFGLFDQQRQLDDFRRIWRHSKDHGRRLATANLIPSRNIPVTFKLQVPRRALIVEE